MRRGQVSFDLMLAVIAALVFIGSLNALGGSIAEMQGRASVRQQLHSIGMGIAAVVSTSDVLGDADSATLSYSIPEIMVPGKKVPQGCSIRIAGDEITLSYEVSEGEMVEETIRFKAPSGMGVPGSASCGGSIEVVSE